ncbi:MAG TPA: alpha-glucan family phosphorylase [Trueperaceae bacterium]
MNILGRLTVLPDLPRQIDRLSELARNLSWTWNAGLQSLFASLDPQLWEATGHNPVLLLQWIDQERLEAAAADGEFLARYREAVESLGGEGHRNWYSGEHGTGDLYAYFCAEYGWHESVQLYSGGLGVLAGDHTKAASELGVPLVGVGLWYTEGYFHQRVAEGGEQQAVFEEQDPAQLPLRRALDANGEEARVSVTIFEREVEVRAWLAQVGAVNVYLLDVDLPQNDPEDRALLKRLYGGDQNTRIAQEMLLGIGGVRMLRALGIAPTAWHMNEGHSAFMVLERCRELVSQGLTFEQAREAVAANTLFTVHTPVAAGNDAFPFDLVERSFGGFWKSLGLSAPAFMDLAKADHGWGEVFSMPALALRFTSGRNGVAELHGETSRLIWNDLWPGVPIEETPIGSVTNGVHAATWMAPEIAGLATELLGDGWRDRIDDEEQWRAFGELDTARLWQVRKGLKLESVRFLRQRLQRQLDRQQATMSAHHDADELFDPEALTIGFARRFATYKRATLIFHDLDRLARLLADPQRPVQLVFAGKAHPADKPGQELIANIHRLSHDDRFRGRILFVEDYDMAVGRALTRGVDVWLNNPRRPLEASGTSGQKAAMNGVLNLSILDGWWPEGYNGDNGWAFGSEREYEDASKADAADADALYDLLEREVVPLYYRRDANGVPRSWMERSRAAIASITPRFNAQRMVKDYVRLYYAPASERGRTMSQDGHAGAKELAAWRAAVAKQWPSIYLSAKPQDDAWLKSGEEMNLEVMLHPGELEGVEIRVEAVYSQEDDALREGLQRVPMHCAESYPDGGRLYRATFRPTLTGPLVYGVRAYPVHELLANPFDARAIRWA